MRAFGLLALLLVASLLLPGFARPLNAPGFSQQFTINLTGYHGNEVGNILRWTPSEKIYSGIWFIDKSLDGENWVVQEARTVTFGEDLRYVDPNVLSLVPQHYRIRHSDFDGAETLSNVIVLTYGDDEPLVELSPNPFFESLKMKLVMPESGEVGFSVFDAFGNKLLGWSEKYEAGGHRVDLTETFDPLPIGVYMIKIRACGKTIVQKAIKQ